MMEVYDKYRKNKILKLRILHEATWAQVSFKLRNIQQDSFGNNMEHDPANKGQY